PLLYWKVGRLPSELRPPEEISGQMRQAFLYNRAQCFKIEAQLNEILNAFNSRGIEVIVLKGYGLAKTVYPDPATRPSGDIDLLVHPDKFTKARTLLKGLGYKCLVERFEIIKGFHWDEVFTRKTNGKTNLDIELHWDLHRCFGNKRNTDIDGLFDRAVSVELAGSSFKVLHHVDALVFCALHMLMTHNEHIRLLWIYDCAMIARRLTTFKDWEILQERSDDLGGRIALEKALKMAQVWAGLQIPSEFNDFSEWTNPTLEDNAAWSNAMARSFKPGVFFKEALLNPSTFFTNVNYLFRLLFPDPIYMRRAYPYSHNRQLPLAYMKRWWKWFKKLAL
ncbi:MAG: nucleotidyltransferase domain-containing protein, partial [Candidatus Anammoxibacter sp.]